jgi:hypothetical protein
MFVCVDDGGAPRVVGWTSVETRERVIECAEPLPMPVRWGYDEPLDAATIMIHRMLIRLSHTGARG